MFGGVVKGKKEPVVNEKHIPVLTVVVNSLTLTFKGDKLQEIVNVMHDWTREALGRGYFPYGSEYADNAGVSSAASGDDSKLALQKFLMMYPLLPKPPIPEDIAHSERYFEAPKSRREILALERAEEERIEQEMIRLANESQMERNQKQISQGREEMKKYQTESEADGFNDEDDEDDERGKTEKKRSKRFNRSVFQKSVTSVDLREQLNFSRQCSAVSGVPDRSVSQLNNVIIPSVPMMVNGVMKFDTTEKKRINFKPTIEESKGLEEVDLPQHVGISWNLAASIAVQPTKTKKVKDGKSSSERLQDLLMETRRRKVDAYFQSSEEVQAEKLAATNALEQNTIQSLRPTDSYAEDSDVKRAEKDVYLYGLSKYTAKKKASSGGSAVRDRPLRRVRESDTVGGTSE